MCVHNGAAHHTHRTALCLACYHVTNIDSSKSFERQTRKTLQNHILRNYAKSQNTRTSPERTPYLLQTMASKFNLSSLSTSTSSPGRNGLQFSRLVNNTRPPGDAINIPALIKPKGSVSTCSAITDRDRDARLRCTSWHKEGKGTR